MTHSHPHGGSPDHDHAHGGSHDHGGPHDHAHEDDSLGELLDLDPTVLQASWEQIHGLVAAAVTTPPHRVVDLGAGTGTGTVALARLFPEAGIVAVDSDHAMPARVAAKAAEHGLGSRVEAVVADLDAGWPDLGPVDLVWASMSLHHLDDPDATLRRVHAAMRPGGSLVAVEFAESLRMLAGADAEVEERAHTLLRAALAAGVPHLTASWAPRLTATGFDVEREQVVAVDVRAPYPPGTTRYAQLWLRRAARGLGDALERPDLVRLLALSEPGEIERLAAAGDLHLRGARTVTIARRP